MDDTAIARAPLHEEVAARLRRRIFAGEFAPGFKLPERVLCAEYGISRTPLREAFKVLAAEGLLELVAHRGARVARLTSETVDELFPVMGALEALAGELACQRITEEGIAEIRSLHYQMALHHMRGELAPYFERNQEIHEKILDAAGNPTLSQVYRGLAGRIRRARYVANMTKGRWGQAVEEHEAMLDALAHRDGLRLAQILKAHLANTCEVVKAAIHAEAAAD